MRKRSEHGIGSPPLSEGKAGTSTRTLALSQQEMVLLAGTSWRVVKGIQVSLAQGGIQVSLAQGFSLES